MALALLGAYALVLFVVSATLEPAANERFFSEKGWVEILSATFWAIAAVIPLRYFRQSPRRSLMFALLFILFAMREADLHKAFTSANILKLTYFTNGMGPEQWLALPFALTSVAVMIYCGLEMLGYLWRCRLVDRSSQMLLIAGMTMAASKVMDRLPNVLRNDYHVFISLPVREILFALEEGLEMVAPLIFIWAFLLVPNLLRPALHTDPP